jgi:hypothetical protein
LLSKDDELNALLLGVLVADMPTVPQLVGGLLVLGG